VYTICDNSEIVNEMYHRSSVRGLLLQTVCNICFTNQHKDLSLHFTLQSMKDIYMGWGNRQDADRSGQRDFSVDVMQCVALSALHNYDMMN